MHTLRERANERSRAMRSVWATSSAAAFFLGETEAYFQGEIVVSTWNGFQRWLIGDSASRPTTAKSGEGNAGDGNDEDIWLQTARESTRTQNGISSSHDPQSLADAHGRYLVALSTSLLLTVSSFTDPLYYLLQQIDHLVALVHRIHAIWQSLDLETDEGVVDAFSDFHKEEKDVKEQLIIVTTRVKSAISELVKCLRDIDQEKAGWDSGFEELVLTDEGVYVPSKVGRVDRLLMKLDFGGWFLADGKAGTEDDDFDE